MADRGSLPAFDEDRLLKRIAELEAALRVLRYSIDDHGARIIDNALAGATFDPERHWGGVIADLGGLE